ncbi:unnamed protein product [Peniophora sp. CBMAI 1063]|nr:unnamed protein product [Peniophora sp. CBMAI 1063]
MAYQTHWPNKYYFYPFGNTSAVCLTRDLPPREPASLLLLGCGDPRNVLYTVFCEAARGLDFTCCDWDPGVLARNVLLLSLISDDKPQDQLWSIFFHIYLDKGSNALLQSQCRQLIALAESLDTWRVSKYGASIRFSTDHTLAELRRFWQLYADMGELPKPRYDALVTKFRAHHKSIRSQQNGVHVPHSAGPLGAFASDICATILNRYWEKGTLANDVEARSANIANPTFVFSRGEDATAVHYGLDPIAPFHLAAVFGNAPNNRPPPEDVVRDVKEQFAAWCSAYRTASARANPPVIRLHVGDALALSSALRVLKETGTLDTGVPHAQWSAERICLNAADYRDGDAPTSFNVVDTSNLTDHIGLLNILSSTTPLLASPCGVLYTETLLFDVSSDPAKYVSSLLVGDLPTMAVMMDLCPVDYLSGFTSRSFVDGILALSSMRAHDADGMPRQLQQGLTWKRPASGDALAVGASSLIVEDGKLATVLYQLYQALFSKYEIKALMNRTAQQSSSVTEHYTRESFALFTKLVCDRLEFDPARRHKVIDLFLDLQTPDLDHNPIDALYVQDLYLQLYRHGLYTVDVFKMPNPRTARFARWSSVPDLVRLTLVVPRSKLDVLNGASSGNNPTPPIECQILTPRSNSIFSSIHLVYGQISNGGTPTAPIPSIRADSSGSKGKDPLLVSFVISTRLLTVLNKAEDVRVCFTLRATPVTTKLLFKLGPRLMIHEASFMDEAQVFVFPEETRHSPRPPFSTRTPESRTALESSPLQELGQSSTASAQIDEMAKRITALTCRVSVTVEEAKTILQSSKSIPDITQVAPCVLRVDFADRRQDVVFPFPVVGSQHKIKMARKSSYVEVVAPLSGGLRPDGMAIDRFAVARSPTTNKPYPWNIHRIGLTALPVVNTTQSSASIWAWLNSHVSLALSARELDLRSRKAHNALMSIKDTMHSLYYHASGAKGPPKHIFQLMDGDYCDMVLFVDKLRYDLASYTVVCDAFFMHLHPSVNDTITAGMGDILRSGGEEVVHVKIYDGEPELWKRLMPAFAERCRTWEHTANCEYVTQKRIPLSTERECNPLCACGRGQGIEDSSVMARPAWKKLVPLVTRIAISPLFSVPYLEPLRDLSTSTPAGGKDLATKCARCSKTGGKDGGALKTCSRCHVYKYCSAECQRADWKTHKMSCRPTASKS